MQRRPHKLQHHTQTQPSSSSSSVRMPHNHRSILCHRPHDTSHPGKPSPHPTPAHQPLWWPLCVVSVCVLVWWLPATAQARDVRLALLIAHQYGWQGEPRLKYVVDGDLRPMARSLQRFGFQVKALKNPSARTVRQTFAWVLQRLSQPPRVTTFLFYYSGHADKHHFHLGPRGKYPLSYKEFVTFFHALQTKRRIAIFDSCFSGEIIRQFGSLRRYRKLFPQGQYKGVRSRRTFDLSKLSLPQQGNEQGLRIISSSLGIAWELHRYRASVFTYHFLKGIKGAADLDHDGKITIDELFDYASRCVQQETGQKPEQLILTRRNNPYALAPAYHSRLRIGSDVIGELKVSISNFVWSKHKTSRQPLRLAVVSGKGLIELKHKQRCWKQRIHLPQNSEISLSSKWVATSCQRFMRNPKGIILPARAELYSSHTLPWALELHADAFGSPLAGSRLLGGVLLGLRHRYLGARLGFWGTNVAFQDATLTQLYLELRAEAGYRALFTHFDFFIGAYGALGLLIQDANEIPKLGSLFRIGFTASPTVWLSTQFGLSLGADAGISFSRRADKLNTFFEFAMRAGIAWRF